MITPQMVELSFQRQEVFLIEPAPFIFLRVVLIWTNFIIYQNQFPTVNTLKALQNIVWDGKIGDILTTIANPKKHKKISINHSKQTPLEFFRIISCYECIKILLQYATKKESDMAALRKFLSKITFSSVGLLENVFKEGDIVSIVFLPVYFRPHEKILISRHLAHHF